MGSNRRRRRRRRGGNRGRQEGQQAQEQSQPRDQSDAEPARPRRGASSSRRRDRGAAPARAPRLQGVRSTVDSFGGFLTIGAVIIAVGAVIVLIFLNRPGGGGSVGDEEFVVPQTTAPVDGRLLGNPDAPVRILALEDFSCAFCGTFSHETKPLLETEYINQGLVSLEFRHMAILGPDSERAAAASECAADQDLFWPYHDILFARQGSAGWATSGNVKDFAREMNDALGSGGLDLDAFDDCVDAGTKELLVRAETDEATRLVVGAGGRASTPTFVINGVLAFQGAQPIEVFRERIDALLPDDSAGEDASAAPDAGPPVDGRLLGDPDAPVQLVAFEDFSCSHCGTFSLETKPLIEAEYISDGRAAIEFRHFAILGEDSERAAAASECAADQNLFWPYHDVLFARQGGSGWASDDNLKGFARLVSGLDLDAFDVCVDSGEKLQVVRDSTDAAGQMIVGAGGQPSTPTFFINGQLAVEGARPIEVFREAIEAALPAGGG